MSASEFQIAPHLERALEAMSKDLSIDPQALVNQAVFAWLRINGYVAPSAASAAVAHAEALAPTVEKKVPAVTGEMSAFVPSKPPGATALGGERKSEPALEAVEPVVAKKKSEPALEPVVPEPAPAPAKKKSEPALDPVAAKKKSEPALEPVAEKKKSEPSLDPVAESEPAVVVSPSAQSVPAVADGPVSSPSGGQLAAMARMKEIAAELDKLTKPWPDWVASEEEEEQEEDEQDADQDDADQDEPEEEEREETGDHSAGASTADEVDKPEPRDPFEADLPPEVNTGENEVEPPPDEEPVGESTVVLRSVPIVLYLEREGADPVRVDSERFIIGRGPTCDLVIDSPRVSREHVAITRSGIRYFLKDLNSSNGTWMGEERIGERELESGDVILLGNEAVTFILRGE